MMDEHYYRDSTGVPHHVDPVRTMWPRCNCGAVVPDIDAHIASERTVIGNQRRMT